MPTTAELQSLILNPREDVGSEYKDWLDPSSSHGRATLARAAIALANHGGGFIVIGFSEQVETLVSIPKPASLPVITQDGVNAAIRRYADPEFHVEVHRVTSSTTGVEHVVVFVPGGHSVPVMSKRDCEGVIAQNRCYIRKPGPRSEEPQTRDEWRELLNRCLRAQREDMLDAIRAIVTGRVEVIPTTLSANDEFSEFVINARQRWTELVGGLPPDMPARFPHGSYEMAFGLIGAEPCTSLTDLQRRLSVARRVKLTGWSTFLEMSVPGLAPYAHDHFVEAWIGRPIRDDAFSRDPSMCDFWRASLNGQLYTIRGFAEDALLDRPPATCLDITLPVWRIGEGLLFAARLAETFENVEQIAIKCRYKGLQGRHLTSVTGQRMMFDDRISQTAEIVLQGRATPRSIRDNLAEVLTPFLIPLYERFDFFQLPVQLVGEESQKLQQRKS